MDHLSCNVIYVNRLVGEDRLIRALSEAEAVFYSSGQPDRRRDQTMDLVKRLLDVFGDVHLCTTGKACLSALSQLQDNSMTTITPTLVLLDTPSDDRLQDQQDRSRSASPTQVIPSHIFDVDTSNEELYGLRLLQKIITEAHLRSISKLVVPVPVISYAESSESSTARQMTDGAFDGPLFSHASVPTNRRLIRTCLDIGAVDVLISPLSSKCITTLEICAYKAHRDAIKEQRAMLEVTKGRKRSWVGVNEQKPFAYLREAMVSGLMNGICLLDGSEGKIAGAHIAVSSQRRAEIAHAVAQWHFCAHSFADDELLVAALIMFKHALAVPDLEPWRISQDQLIDYLVACRAAYNSFVPYHNFRHVVDVLQATFHFLVRIGSLPPCPTEESPRVTTEKSPIAALLSPFEALTLLITAIGHDVGHPGVNNGFLATLNAPLAQLYNDRSVLESFHCAAYSQILRRYWPSAFEDRKLRSLMISSILATDMGLHFDYMKKLNDVQDRLHDGSSTDTWNERQIDDYKALACSLLIKCADISNVARHHETALKWMHILSEEFSRQASMEAELDIKSSLISQPKKDILSLSGAQLGFMNMFAIPLFRGVADIMPPMQYTVDELEINKNLFEQKVQVEKAKQQPAAPQTNNVAHEEDEHPRSDGTGASQGKEQTGESADPVDGMVQVPARAPQVAADVMIREQQQMPLVSDEPADLSHALPRDEEMWPKEHDATAPSFAAVQQLPASDILNGRYRGEGSAEGKAAAHYDRQRCSETTEGSTSGAFAGDWQSQATTATTEKVALSPSTQGTSIVSNESVERRPSATGLNISPPSASSNSSPGTVVHDAGVVEDASSNGGSIGKAEGKSLRKKSSRFRMRDFPFFRRHKASSPPLPAAEKTT